MKKVGEVLLKIITVLFAITLGWIIINSLFLGKDVIFHYNKVILPIFTIIYMLLMIFIYKKIIPKLVNNKYLPLILILLFTAISIIIGYNLRLNPSWDMGRVFEIATEYVKTGEIQDDYLYEFPNNIVITYIYIFVLKIISVFKITDYITAITVFNSIIVSLTVVCLYFATKKLFNKKNALMVLIISLFTTPLYLYTAVYYTDTMSMLFCTLSLLLYAYIRKQKLSIKNVILQILFGLTVLLCIKVKLTSAFIIIAILVYELLRGTFGKFIKKFWISLVAMIIFMFIWNIAQNNIILPDKEKQNYIKMPVEHWILTGLVGNGGYNSEIRDYTDQFDGYENKRKGDLEKIKEIIKDYTFSTFVTHINEKLKYTWADGTYYAPEKLRREPVEKGILYEYVVAGGKKVDYYKYLPQSMHIAMLVFILIDALIIIKENKYKKGDVFLCISMFGLIVFLLLWENRSRYVLTLVPIMLLLETRGIGTISKYKIRGEKENEKK